MSTSSFSGSCPAPFLQEDLFPTTGGFIDGRLCETVAALGNITCCLPCPLTDWVYSDGFVQSTKVANWLNVGALTAVFFMLASFAILDKKWTHAHYLGSCMLVGVACMEIAFIVPLVVEPEQCLNEITPNDMTSEAECAITGSFLLFGAWTTILWVFYRALSLHMQICWAMVPGRKFFLTGMVLGWGLPAIALVLALLVTGVSYRFGNVCHINHTNSLQDFWGPLLAFGAAGMIIQFITMGYCIHVYIKSLLHQSAPSTQGSSQLPAYSTSVRTASARQTYRRIRKIIMLQWRGAAIVICVLLNIIFFALVFVSIDNTQVRVTSDNAAAASNWLLCLFEESGDKNKCLSLVTKLVTPEAELLAVLILLSVVGFWCLIFLGRLSMLRGWVDLFRRKISRRHEFVSVDAHGLRDYEMLTSPNPKAVVITEPEPVASPDTNYSARAFSPTSQNAGSDYFSRDSKYRSPPMSFSSPRPPSAQQNQPTWDPSSTHAPSHSRTLSQRSLAKTQGPTGYSRPAGGPI